MLILVNPRDPNASPPEGAVMANPAKLSHINTYGGLPKFYLDRPFKCRDCGSDQVWTAEQQKWWYEEAKGHIDSYAVRCRACRKEPKKVPTRPQPGAPGKIRKKQP